jgi:hypothetical protein
MIRRTLIAIAVALLAAGGVAGCGAAGDGPEASDRGAGAVESCRAHGGVVAFEDDVVICRDQTYQEVEE